VTESRASGYATAILAIAQAEGDLDRVEDEVFQVGRAVEASPDLRQTLSDPRLPLERRQAIVNGLLGNRVAPVTINAISMVVAAGRGADLPDIADELVSQAAATRERAVAEVRSAVPLDDATRQRLAESLSRATKRNVEVRVVVDPAVIGGLAATVGDTVIDGTVRRRLESLRDSLRNR
jgi:F-type H+-transporting ATPase subunit delta